jgi:replicative DNA helicase
MQHFLRQYERADNSISYKCLARQKEIQVISKMLHLLRRKLDMPRVALARLKRIASKEKLSFACSGRTSRIDTTNLIQ